MSRSDNKHSSLLTLTALSSGHIDDLEDTWLKSVVVAAKGNTTNDLWLAYFLENGATSGDFNTAAFEYLGVQGHTGALSDRWDKFWAAGGPSGAVSAEVQAVFDRMSALTTTEENAIEALVDGLISDGLYTAMDEIYAPCLNATDFLIGFKADTLINSASPGTHTPGEYIDFTAGAQHLLEGRAYDSFAILNHFVGCYVVLYDPDVVANSDLFGVATGVNECYYRWRGNDTSDENAIIHVTAATPRAVGMVRPTGDVVGAGCDGVVTILQLIVGGVTDATTRTLEGLPITHPMQWHGQNIDGVPSVGNVQNSRYSVMFHLNKTSPPNVTTIRVRMLQFLRDIGVTAVPATVFTIDGGASILVGLTTISISWTDPVGGTNPIDFIRVFRDFVEVGTVAAGVEQFDDSGLDPDTSYFYFAVVVDTLGFQSVPSPGINVSTLPEQMTMTQYGSDFGDKVTDTLQVVDSPDSFQVEEIVSIMAGRIALVLNGGNQDTLDPTVTIVDFNGAGMDEVLPMTFHGPSNHYRTANIAGIRAKFAAELGNTFTIQVVWA